LRPTAGKSRTRDAVPLFRPHPGNRILHTFNLAPPQAVVVRRRVELLILGQIVPRWRRPPRRRRLGSWRPAERACCGFSSAGADNEVEVPYVSRTGNSGRRPRVTG
jgi:hypothetical protein